MATDCEREAADALLQQASGSSVGGKSPMWAPRLGNWNSEGVKSPGQTFQCNFLSGTGYDASKQTPASQGQGQPDVNQLIAIMTSMMNQNAVLIQSLAQEKHSETFHYNILPDLSHNIDDFTGLELAVEAKAWLKQLEFTATLHRCCF